MKTLIILCILFVGCSTTKTTGYLTNVKQAGERQSIQKVETPSEAERIVYETTGLEFSPLEMYLGKKKSYFEFSNGDIHIYIQKK